MHMCSIDIFYINVIQDLSMRSKQKAEYSSYSAWEMTMCSYGSAVNNSKDMFVSVGAAFELFVILFHF